MKRDVSKHIGLLLIILCMTVFSFSVYAENGDGSGGGQNKSLEVMETNPAQNAENIPVDAVITFKFNKNVVNISVIEQNITCFSMTDSKGNDVTIEVIYADDQIERDKRQEISIKPISPLEAGESYTVTISKDFSSKSGAALADQYILTFKTAEDTSNSDNTTSDKADLAAEKSNKGLIGIGVLIVAAIIVFIVFKKRK